MPYGPCVCCGNPAKNKCHCGRGYCAVCRKLYKSQQCCYCRNAAKARTEQARIARAHAKTVAQSGAGAASAPLYTPGTTAWMPTPQPLPAQAAAQYNATTPVPAPAPVAKRPSRSTLNAMDDAEFAQWQAATVAALLDCRERTTSYLGRRAARGTRTSTDSAMERDLLLYEDLLEVLGELKAAHSLSLASSGSTGAMLSYDASQPGTSFTPDPEEDDDTIDFYASKGQPKP